MNRGLSPGFFFFPATPYGKRLDIYGPAEVEGLASSLRYLAETLAPAIASLADLAPDADARRTSLERAKSRLEGAAAVLSEAAARTHMSGLTAADVRRFSEKVAAQSAYVGTDDKSVKRFAKLAESVLTISRFLWRETSSTRSAPRTRLAECCSDLGKVNAAG